MAHADFMFALHTKFNSAAYPTNSTTVGGSLITNEGRQLCVNSFCILLCDCGCCCCRWMLPLPPLLLHMCNCHQPDAVHQRARLSFHESVDKMMCWLFHWCDRTGTWSVFEEAELIRCRFSYAWSDMAIDDRCFGSHCTVPPFFLFFSGIFHQFLGCILL